MRFPAHQVRTWLACALCAASVCAQQPERAPEAPGLHVLSRSPAEVGRTPRVRLPREPIYLVDDAGCPILSPAGYVRLRLEGPGFYTAAGMDDQPPPRPGQRIMAADSRLPEVLWGDLEAIASLRRVIDAWRALDHPPGSAQRIGIGDISSPYGGFPDLKHDLMSDHLTHQTGCNINILMPCRRQPEVIVHLGKRNEQWFDAAAARRLVNLLIAEGVSAMTTSVATRLLDQDASDLPPLDGIWTESGSDRNAFRWGHTARPRGTPTWVVLLKDPANHGSHFNVLFGRR